MKIAHVVSTFPPHTGGMGLVCFNEAMRLAKLGHEVTVFTLRYPDQKYDADLPFKITFLKPWLQLGNAGLVPQLLNKVKDFDLVHLHYPFYGGAEWLCFSKIPLVITYHMDAQLTGVKAVIGGVYDFIWPKFLFKKAKKIIAVDGNHFKTTKFGKQFFDNAVEISNGVDTAIFNPHAVSLESLGLQHIKEKKIILFVANPMPLKRLDLVLNALKKMADDNLALVVVGGGYDLEKYKIMAKDLNLKNVTFAGRCTDLVKLSDYYNIANCVVVPSDYESFSLVAAEAAACGRPVVASNITAMSGRINNGCLFTKGSAEDLANVLKKVLSMNDTERNAITEKAKADIKENYSWEKHVEKLIEVYGRI